MGQRKRDQAVIIWSPYLFSPSVLSSRPPRPYPHRCVYLADRIAAGMDTRTALPLVPLHLTSLALISPTNGPLFVRSFTGKADELRHYHLAHAALDVIEERSGSQSLAISNTAERLRSQSS